MKRVPIRLHVETEFFFMLTEVLLQMYMQGKKINFWTAKSIFESYLDLVEEFFLNLI